MRLSTGLLTYSIRMIVDVAYYGNGQQIATICVNKQGNNRQIYLDNNGLFIGCIVAIMHL